MTEREKVIEGFKCHMAMLACNKCPYYCGDTCSGIDDVVYDALALLEAQEPVRPVPGMWDRDIPLFNCGACGSEIGAGGIAKYCFHCGRKVKWDD